jgi:fused signal recognition particle receptor
MRDVPGSPNISGILNTARLCMFGRQKKIEEGLTRTRQSFFGRIGGLFGRGDAGPEVWENLEEILIQADVGVQTTVDLVEKLRARAARDKLRDANSIQMALRQELVAILTAPSARRPVRPPVVGVEIILVVGVNGVGKTTSIAKLARYYRGKGKSPILAAADTFRAAAGEQLDIWGQRAGVPVIGGTQSGADPGAVVFDAIQAAQARKADVLIVDTAGRLHTKSNLMEELKKIKRVTQKQVPGAPHQVLLVMDATTGQNALTQARQFTAAAEVTGLILTKLDGTAKGGFAFAITQELGLPICFIGTGEKIDDLDEFNADEFVQALFE